MLLVKTVGGSSMYPEYIMEKKDTTDISDVIVEMRVAVKHCK